MATDLVTITAAASAAVTTAEAKTHMRVDYATDDTYIDELVDIATTQVEGITGFKLMAQTSELRADSFRDVGIVHPSMPDILRLRVAPISTLTSVKYDDADDTEQTMSSSDYWEDLKSVPNRIRVKTQWPETEEKIAAVRIRMATGFASAAAIPEHFKLAIKLLVGHWYENREETTELVLSEIPVGVNNILMARAEYHFVTMMAA